MAASHNPLVILGPTASGKTRLGVEMARAVGGEIVSADSRQVYRGLDIGAGKDLDEYSAGGPPVPYHLIDVVGLDTEFSVFDFQQLFYRVFEELRLRCVPAVMVGGSGMYLEAVVERYRLVETPPDPALLAELEGLSDQELEDRLRALRGSLHDTTDLATRDRLIRAVEIATASTDGEPPPAPAMRPLVLGVRWPRSVLRARIRERLRQRIDEGLIDEVRNLHASGVPWKRLHALGLEYRFVAHYLQGDIRHRNDLEQKLATAIGQFAKRQDTWFRRMERRGTEIHWIDRGKFEEARRVVEEFGVGVGRAG